LFPAEADLEKAIVHASRLTIALVEGRKAAKLPITMGQDGLEHVSRATAKLIDARGEMGAAHESFREAQYELGLKAVSFGDIYDCPNLTGLSETGVVDPERPQAYRGKWPIREHRNLQQVALDEQAPSALSNDAVADAA